MSLSFFLLWQIAISGLGCSYLGVKLLWRLNFIAMEENKNSVVDIVPVVSKITEHKLNGSNYIEWSKTIKFYLRSVAKDDHLTEEPPNNNTRKLWMQDDARLFLQIKNSINSDIVGLLSHYEFVKELMDYLDFFYFGKVRSKVLYPV